MNYSGILVVLRAPEDIFERHWRQGS